MRRISLLFAATLPALAMTAAKLSAQASGSMETGSLIANHPAGGYGTSGKDARAISRRFAECSIRRGRRSAELYLAAPIGSADQARLQRQVLVDDCLGAGELSLPPDVIRGALFEQLYLLEYKTAPPADLSTVPTIDYTFGYSAPLTAGAINGIALAQFGDCVARADAGHARDLLTSLPDSTGETAAVGGLMSHLAPCIPQGRTIHFSRSVLRAAIAEGLYRLERAATGTPWGAK
jgi:hypothetical protein